MRASASSAIDAADLVKAKMAAAASKDTAASHTSTASLRWAIDKVARGHGMVIDSLRLDTCLQRLPGPAGLTQLPALASGMGWKQPRLLTRPDQPRLPLLAHAEGIGWTVVVDREPDGRWALATAEGTRNVAESALADRSVWVDWSGSQALAAAQAQGRAGFSAMLRTTLLGHRSSLLEAALASGLIGLISLLVSMFSMQVYDRVLPAHSVNTLAVLAVGVALGIMLELGLKHVRSHVMDHVVVDVDNRLSRHVFQRLLQLRVDQLPASVGSLAAQMRGYEQVRGFFTASTLFALIDLPLAVLFILVIAFVSSPLVAAVPLVLALVAAAIGLAARRRIERLAQEGAQMSNLKTGLLVEAVEGVETIKAGSGGWKFLSRWIGLTGKTIQNDLQMRRTSEGVTHWANALHQLSYVGVLVVGSLLVMEGHMTSGGLLAAAILGGRILSPMMTLPALIVQYAHAKAAIEGLERFYALQTDYNGAERVLTPERLRGNYTLQDVSFAYTGQPTALKLPMLSLKAGERVGVIGAIGSGKSTLLRLLSGLYTPEHGRVLLDGLELSHISRELISRQIGFLQQEHRLFQGTLRENLLIGMADPGDDVLQAAMERTGMAEFVQAHPKGLDRLISEGGKGLSGGQRQLLAFTRLLLTGPQILLLDEPTANMDPQQEARCLAWLQELTGRTLVMVTHKPSLLPLIDRLIYVAGGCVVLDGPRDEVLRQLGSAPAVTPSSTPAQPHHQ